MSHTNMQKRINSLNKPIICEGLINFKTICHYMYVGSPCATKLVVILLGMSCSLWHPLGLVKYGFWPLRIGLVPVHFVNAWLTDWSIGVWRGWMVCYVSWAVAELFLWFARIYRPASGRQRPLGSTAIWSVGVLWVQQWWDWWYVPKQNVHECQDQRFLSGTLHCSEIISFQPSLVWF